MSYRLIATTIVMGALGWAVGACASGTVTDFGGGGPGGGHTSSGGGQVGGAGGSGANGGSGGSGGSSPCAVDCTQIKTPPCQVATCNAQTGQCEVVPDQDGAACEDGAFCTVNDACLAGVCEAGEPNDCGMTPDECKTVTCDETSQSCQQTPAQNGDPCQVPGDLCIKGATCSNGQCLGGTPEDCFFFPVPDDCHVGVCNPQSGQCEAQPGNDNDPCADPNDLCTLNKTCAAGVCQGGQAKDCSALTQGCVLGVCDAVTGQCVAQDLNNGDPCDDLNGCTSGEICQNGTCSGGTTITQCINADGCCPVSCSIANDDDCNLCGNSTLEQDEENDPPPGPSTAVPLDPQTCRYDFSGINQLYCNGTCGNWGGGSGCDQGDADVLCKLKMDNPLSTATSYQTATAMAAPGICCPPPTWPPGNSGCVDLGVLSSRGVSTNVSVHDTDVLASHGAGTVVTNVQCTNP